MENDQDLDIIFWPSSMTKNSFSCKLWELKTYYFINSTHDLNATLIKRIIKDGKFNVKKETFFNSSVITTKNKFKNYEFQIEDNLVLVTNLKTKEEFFSTKDKIKSTWTFNNKNWEELKQKKQSLTPLNSNITTNETDMFEQK